MFLLFLQITENQLFPSIRPKRDETFQKGPYDPLWVVFGILKFSRVAKNYFLSYKHIYCHGKIFKILFFYILFLNLWIKFKFNFYVWIFNFDLIIPPIVCNRYFPNRARYCIFVCINQIIYIKSYSWDNEVCKSWNAQKIIKSVELDGSISTGSISTTRQNKTDL